MGGMDDDDLRKPSRNRGVTITSTRSKIKIFILVLSTNLLSIYLFSHSSFRVAWPEPVSSLWNSDALIRELNSTRLKLSVTQTEVSSLHQRLATSNSLLESLLADLGRNRENPTDNDFDSWREKLPEGELKLAVGPHKLPLGYTLNLGSDELFPSMGTACPRFEEELKRYMTYDVHGECPSDDVAAQRLMLKGCEPLPRRRCRPKSPINYTGPTPFPASLWATPPDTSITWDPYSCKNYKCLVKREKSPGSQDCKDCFNLAGRERSRWMFDNDMLDYGIEEVLKTRPEGAIRVGLDIGGGSGTFAARMRERDVTIVTTSMNFDGPFNSFIASRGLIPLHVSVAHRLPFFENTLDIVHSMHVLSNWIPDLVLEFALFDIYRVLRPGGLFWLDHFFCVGSQLNGTYVPMFDRIGFKKLRWHAGRKMDKGVERNEWYLSALMEKPMT